MSFTWEQIRTAVVNLNRLQIEKIGKSYNLPRLEQEGVMVHEIVEQILSMAPGKHPHLGPILLDLAEKLKTYPREWH